MLSLIATFLLESLVGWKDFASFGANSILSKVSVLERLNTWRSEQEVTKIDPVCENSQKRNGGIRRHFKWEQKDVATC